MIQISQKEFDRLVTAGCTAFSDVYGNQYILLNDELLQATITPQEVNDGYVFKNKV